MQIITLLAMFVLAFVMISEGVKFMRDDSNHPFARFLGVPVAWATCGFLLYQVFQNTLTY